MKYTSSFYAIDIPADNENVFTKANGFAYKDDSTADEFLMLLMASSPMWH